MEDPNDYNSDVAAPDAAQGTTDSDTAAGGADASELSEQRDKYLRLAAEYDNFRRRTAKERQEAQQRGQGDLLKSMIESLDDLGRFAHVDPATADAKTIVDGVSMVEKKLLKTLSGLGLELINPIGELFDPALHEAVMTEPAASPDEDHMVARVFQQGYRFNGQLLRPARVVVKQWNG
jgi:molecular chaperone GrpE